MKRIMTKDDYLLIYSMGKRFRVTAIFTSENDANAYMEKHEEAALIAEHKPFLFIASKYDDGKNF